MVRQCKKTSWAYSVKTDSSLPGGLDICLSFVGRSHHYAGGLSLNERLSLPNGLRQGGLSRVQRRIRSKPPAIKLSTIGFATEANPEVVLLLSTHDDLKV